MNPIEEREAAIMHVAGSEEETAALRRHVQEIIEGEAFRGSNRCGRFLTYIVEQAIAGRFEALKERVIGLELFARSPAYDTGEDAIVRVTASDVRKRLLQHYGKCGTASEFRINLPLGSYIPEILHVRRDNDGQIVTSGSSHNLPGAPTGFGAATQDFTQTVQSRHEPATAEAGASDLDTAPWLKRFGRRWLLFAGLVVALNLVMWGLLRKDFLHGKATSGSASVSVLPWSAFFSSPHPTYLITSDPDIAGIQRLTGRPISVSDYANHNYIPEHTALSPEVRQICLDFMRGDKAASADTQIAVDVAELAKIRSKKISVEGARSLQFSALKTDDNFIFLGSPYSDPWFSVFNDQLDFRIFLDKNSREEAIRNVHPRANEQPLYVPTAKGGATGQSFAVIAFIGNPDQYGQVLLLAGLNSEGTHAAGRLVTDMPHLSKALRNCGISSAGPPKHFEMLLRVKTMAGYPSQFNVVACHILPGGSAS